MHALAVVKGPDRGNVYSLSDLPVRIGRDGRNEIPLRDALVSRFQARIETQNGKTLLRDEGSTNGTEVNGFKVELHTLKPGDMVQMGNTVLVFYVQKEGSAEPPPVFDPGQTVTGFRADFLARDKESDPVASSHMLRFHPDELVKSHRALSVLYAADEVFELSSDPGEVVERLASLVMKSLQPLQVVVLLSDEGRAELMPKVVLPKGRNDDRPALSRSLVRMILEEREAVLLEDVRQQVDLGDSIVRQLDDIRSVMAVPIKARDEVIGILQVVSSSSCPPFNEDDLRVLVALASKTGAVLDGARLYRELHQLFVSTTQALIDALEAKDPYTRGHSDRVAGYSVALGREVGLSEAELGDLHHAASLHDLGKIGMPDRILHSTDKLSVEEFARVKEHPVVGARLLRNIPLLQRSIDGVRHHHEAWDGSGYPDGLADREIPVIARVIAVADIFDALTSDRTYRQALSPAEAMEELSRLSGSKLDPELVIAFARVVAARTGVATGVAQPGRTSPG